MIVPGNGDGLHIDGTCAKEDVFVGTTRAEVAHGITHAPFMVFDEDKQENIAGPFDTFDEAEAARDAIRKARGGVPNEA